MVLRLLAVLPVLLLQDPVKGPVKETYEDGKTKATYTLDENGKKDGPYAEYFPNGKKKINAHFVHGVPERVYEEFHENGKTRLKKKYVKGRLEGELLRFDEKGVLLHRMGFRKDEVFVYPDFVAAVPAHPRKPEEIRKKLEELDPAALRKPWPAAERFIEKPVLAAPHKPGKLKKEYLEDALRHLQSFRWLSMVPHEIGMHEPYHELCQHGAVVNAVNGDLSHTPPLPPGMAKEFHEKGYQACENSNLSYGTNGSLRQSIEGFMNDSDASNINTIGHRMWLLAPTLGRVGFGEAPKGDLTFNAVWVLDSAPAGPRTKSPRPPPGPKPVEFVSYPARGHYPVEYLDREAAWSCSPEEGFQTGTKDEVKVEVWRLTEEYDLDQKLELNHLSIAPGRGSARAVVFRPVFPGPEPLEGRRFLVSIAGKSARLAYVVEFIRRTPK